MSDRGMNQDINLLTLPSAGQAPYPRARHVALTVACLIVVGIVAGLWYDHRNESLQRTARQLDSDIDELVFNLEERSYFLAERNADAALVAELKRREREANDKTRVLDLLSGESVGNTDGFSAHLAAFGRRHPEGLWLERIRIDDGGRNVLLRGLTLDAALVPRFLTELRQEPVLAGTSFATFALSSDERSDRPLRFALATACTDEAAAEQVCVTAADAEPQP